MVANERLNEFISIGACYSEYVVDDTDCSDLKGMLLYSTFKFDMYCPNCGRDSTFSRQPSYGSDAYSKKEEALKGEINVTKVLRQIDSYVLAFECARDSSHQIHVVLHSDIDNSKLIKYGHYPDNNISLHIISDKYRELLSDEAAELHNALMLNAHGAFIGAFTYLRRIFERQIDRTFERNSASLGIEPDEFGKRMKMEQRIDALKSYLPKFIVDNKKALYAVLSKGVHQWTEPECREQFPMVEKSIEMILNREMERIQQEKDESELTNLLRKADSTGVKQS